MASQIAKQQNTEVFNPAFEAAIRAECARAGRQNQLTKGAQYRDLYWSLMGA